MTKISQLPSDLPQTGDYVPGLQIASTSTKRFSFANLINLVFNNAPAGAPVFLTGMLVPYGGSSAPTGWLICDGSSLLRASYPSLFTAIGTAFGSADGTHFNLPNLKGSMLVGYNSGDSDFSTIGQTGGQKDVKAHNHTITMEYGATVNASLSPAVGTYLQIAGRNAGTKDTGTNNPVGSTGTGTTNMNPYVVVNYLIKI